MEPWPRSLLAANIERAETFKRGPCHLCRNLDSFVAVAQGIDDLADCYCVGPKCSPRS